ncbi:MAG: hypothetical protein F6K10_21185, partial [Moorea sp. SIO2B7]|nr:hypothetical protein [Moorena sp. SIO2B7]
VLNESSAASLAPSKPYDTVEVYWWSLRDNQSREGRYEVEYKPGFTVKLNEGAKSWAEFYGSSDLVPTGEAPVFWVGRDWHWQGDRFVRGFDQVPLNFFGGGPLGISPQRVDYNKPHDIHAMRGELDLLNLSKDSTEVKYYSGWVDDELLKPYLTIIPTQQAQTVKPNPLVIEN